MKHEACRSVDVPSLLSSFHAKESDMGCTHKSDPGRSGSGRPSGSKPSRSYILRAGVSPHVTDSARCRAPFIRAQSTLASIRRLPIPQPRCSGTIHSWYNDAVQMSACCTRHHERPTDAVPRRTTSGRSAAERMPDRSLCSHSSSVSGSSCASVLPKASGDSVNACRRRSR
jgi:hypothetical protein